MPVLREGESLRRAVVGVLERQLDLVFDVAARTLAHAATATNSGGSAGTTAAHSAAEERREEIREGIGVAEQLLHLFLSHRAVAAAPSAAADVDVEAAAEWPRAGLRARLLVHAPVGPELVVLLALLGIAEHFVGFVDFLEAGFSGLVARIDVRVKLAGQFAERLLDVLFRRRLRDAERLVVVLEFHRPRVRSPRSGGESR